MVIILRDVSDRIRRFEAEKQLAIQSTEREKDSQTNRFTKHEVKNGLLSAIGLCDAVKENSKQSKERVRHSMSDIDSMDELHKVEEDCLSQLDVTLNEILDTVLSEAMSRDVTHEV